LAEVNQEFLMYKNNVSVEGYVKWTNKSSVFDADKFDWLVKPMKEGLEYNMT